MGKVCNLRSIFHWCYVMTNVMLAEMVEKIMNLMHKSEWETYKMTIERGTQWLASGRDTQGLAR